MNQKVLVADMTREYLKTCEEDPSLRLRPKAFTRHRKLGAKRLLMILLQRLASCLQLGLDRFCERLEEEPVSKQAFSKARGLCQEKFAKVGSGSNEANGEQIRNPGGNSATAY